MPREKLPQNKGLPKRWRFTRNAYYYQVPQGHESKWDGKKTFKLGNSLSEAYKVWAERLSFIENARTINQLLDRYALEIAPTKSVNTQAAYALYMKYLRPVFGEQEIGDLQPCDIHEYVDKRKRKTEVNGKTRGGLSIAKREVAMLSDAYTHAVMWGYINKHPFKGELKLETEKGRDRYIENWELKEFLSLEQKRKKDPTLVIQAYTRFKLITGLRQQDILSLKVNQLKEDGIHVMPLKTAKSSKKEIIIEWSDALRNAIDELISVRPVDISPYLVCTRRGQSYYDGTKADPASGWKSIWRRYMGRVLEETKLEEKFTEHDLRAKTASDLEDIDHAQKLLAHTSKKMTAKYIRKPEIVKPAK